MAYVPTMVASSAGSVAAFHQPMYPASRHHYYGGAAMPMSAVLPGQAYYPTHAAMPMTAGPMMAPATAYGYGHMPAYGGMPYYGARPTVIIGAPPSRRHRRHRSRGFLGYL